MGGYYSSVWVDRVLGLHLLRILLLDLSSLVPTLLELVFVLALGLIRVESFGGGVASTYDRCPYDGIIGDVE